MKKVKIMLAAIAVVGIVGGSLAFKTAKIAGPIFTGTLGSGVCTTQVNAVIKSGTANVAASNSALTSGCPDVFTSASE
jgi:hypothetical protein